MGEKFDEAISSVSNFVATHAPEILTGIGIGGMATAGIWAVKVTPKVQEELKEEANKQETKSLSAWDKFKIGFKYYALPIVTGGLAAGALISSTSISVKRSAAAQALATAYAVSESTLKNYSRKVVETIGEKKEREIQDKMVKDKLEEEPVGKRVYDPGKGKTHFILEWNRLEFYYDIYKFDKVIAELKAKMAYENEITLNDLYTALELYEIDSCKEGDIFGWDIEHGVIGYRAVPYLRADGEPMRAIVFTPDPRPLGY